jgi:DNA repair protein RadC
MLTIKQLPNSERPYEKLEMYGEKTLSNSELLAIILKTGTKEQTAVSLAQSILALNGEEGIRGLQNISLLELQKIKGVGKVKAIQIKAVCELAKRMEKPLNLNAIIKEPKDVANLLMNELRYEKRETVKILILNTKNVVQKIIDIATRKYFLCKSRCKTNL